MTVKKDKPTDRKKMTKYPQKVFKLHTQETTYIYIVYRKSRTIGLKSKGNITELLVFKN